MWIADPGTNDFIQVMSFRRPFLYGEQSIPKGKYIPTLKNRPVAESFLSDDQPTPYGLRSIDEGRIIAVLPFQYETINDSVKSFGEGLCLQMSSVLTRIKDISVVSYRALKNLEVSHPDYRALGTKLGFNHLITGTVQTFGNIVRVTVQLMNCINYRLKWSETFEQELKKSNFFKIEDEICKRVVGQIEEIASTTCRVPKLLSFAS